LGPSRELCGTTPQQFGDLLIRLVPIAEQRRRDAADRPGRRRAPGAGRPPKPFWLRLLVALTLLRLGISVRATGRVLGVHERSVRRYRDEIEELLVIHGFQPAGAIRPIRTLDDLAVYVEEHGDEPVMISGTEVRRWSPELWEDQKQAWSGKTKAHVVKATVVSDRSRRPLWVEANPTGDGRTNDIAMLRAQTGLMTMLTVAATAGAVVLADRGYQTLWKDLGADRVITPVYKTRYGPLSDNDRRFNRQLSSRRMPVEHAIRAMKQWHALDYRRRPAAAFDRTAKAIGILATITQHRHHPPHGHDPTPIPPQVLRGGIEWTAARI
jgi:hypothetical protein